MEELFNGFTIEISPGAFPFSTDSVVLSGFARLPKNAKVLDLGSGCGTLGVLLCARDPHCQVTGIEIDPTAHETALKNAAANAIEDRLSSICTDLTAVSSFIAPGSFDCCISNPPYFSSGFRSKTAALTRHESTCNLEDVFSAAAWSLKYGGDFFLVHKPERLAELFAAGATHKLEPKRMLLLRHRPDAAVSLVVLQFKKSAKPGLIWEEAILHDTDGQPSKYYRELYHLEEVT